MVAKAVEKKRRGKKGTIPRPERKALGLRPTLVRNNEVYIRKRQKKERGKNLLQKRGTLFSKRGETQGGGSFFSRTVGKGLWKKIEETKNRRKKGKGKKKKKKKVIFGRGKIPGNRKTPRHDCERARVDLLVGVYEKREKGRIRF